MSERPDSQELRYFLVSCFLIYIAWLVIFDSVGRTAAQLPSRDLTLALDRSIPFVPELVWIYLMGYLYPLLPFLAIKDWHRFNAAVLAFIIGNMAAYMAYFLIPL